MKPLTKVLKPWLTALPIMVQKNKEKEYQKELRRLRQKFSLSETAVGGNLNKEEKNKRGKLFLAVIIITIFILFGWSWSLKYNFSKIKNSKGTEVNQTEWRDVKAEFDKSFALIKEGIDVFEEELRKSEARSQLTVQEAARLKAGLIAKATEDWIIYNNFDYNFSLKYPPDWQLENLADQIIFSNESAKVVIAIAEDIARPSLADEKIENFWLDNLGVKIYHDVYTDSDQPLDKVIGRLPKNGQDIYVAGYGEIFNKMILTFKFIEIEK